MNNHISSQRRNAAQQKILNKIKVLEGYCNNGISEGAFIPLTEAAFCRWVDSKLGIEKIGSPNTLYKPYNKELKLKIANLIETLTTKKIKKEKRINLIALLRLQIKEKDKLISDLAGQLHSTRDELQRLRKRENFRSSNRMPETVSAKQENNNVILFKPHEKDKKDL